MTGLPEDPFPMPPLETGHSATFNPVYGISFDNNSGQITVQAREIVWHCNHGNTGVLPPRYAQIAVYLDLLHKMSLNQNPPELTKEITNWIDGFCNYGGTNE